MVPSCVAQSPTREDMVCTDATEQDAASKWMLLIVACFNVVASKSPTTHWLSFIHLFTTLWRALFNELFEKHPQLFI